MKTTLLLTILFLTSCSLRNKSYAPTHQLKNDPFGIGLMHITVKEQDIPLYDTGKSKTTLDTIRIRKIFPKTDNSPFEFKTSILKENLKPYRIYGGHVPTKYDYLKKIAYAPIELTFRVIQKAGNYYYVVADEKDNRMAVIEDTSINNPNVFSFETWGSYLMSAESIETESTHQVLIYNRPNGHVVNSAPNIKFKVIEIKGYWLRITELDEKKTRTAHWIKWRDGNKALTIFILNFKYYRTYI